MNESLVSAYLGKIGLFKYYYRALYDKPQEQTIAKVPWVAFSTITLRVKVLKIYAAEKEI